MDSPETRTGGGTTLAPPPPTIAPPRAGRRFPLWAIGVLGLAVTFVGMACAGNWGLPNVLFVVGGPAVAILANWIVFRSWRPARFGRLLQVLLLAAVGGIAFGAAVVSSRISPEAACREVFGVDVPGSVSVRESRRQFYDGTIVIFRFISDEKGVSQLCSARQFQSDDERMGMYRQGVLSWTEVWQTRLSLAAIADRSWHEPREMSQPRLLKWEAPGGSSRTYVIWDAFTGEGYAVYSAD